MANVSSFGQGASQVSAGAVTMTANANSGDLLVLIVFVDTTTPSTFTISDSTGGSNTYTRDDAFGVNSTHSIEVQRSVLSASVTSVTVTPNTGVRACVYAWKILQPSGSPPGDNMGTANGEGRNTSGTTVSANLQSWTTSNANDDLVACVAVTASTTLTGVTSGWVAESTASVTSDTGLKMWGFHQELTASGSQSLTGTLGASSVWELIAGQYKYTPVAASGVVPIVAMAPLIPS